MANYQSSYTGAVIDGVISQKRSEGYFPTYPTSASSVGSETKPIYINSSGIATASSKNFITQPSQAQVGNAYTPVYINSSGEPVACNVMPVGSSAKPNTHRIATIASDGVMEVGQYIDFHNSTTSSDNTFRIENGSANTLAFRGTNLSLIHSTTNKTGVTIFQDTEGGSIGLYKYNSNEVFELDRFSDTLRIYTNNAGGNNTYRAWFFHPNGVFQSPKGILIDENMSSSWIDGSNDYTNRRALIEAFNVPTDGSFYPWVRQRAGGWYFAQGVIPSETSWYLYSNSYSQTNNVWTGQVRFHVYGRMWTACQPTIANVETQIGTTAASGNIYLYSQATGGAMGCYTSYGAIFSIGSNGVVSYASSDKRVKVDKGLLSNEETRNILSDLPVINFIYTADVEKNNLEQSGFYAQDLRDILLKYNYKNRGYLWFNRFEDDYDGEEVENDQEYSYEKNFNTEKQNITPSIEFDITVPEEEVRLYQIDYKKFIPLLVKGWQMHEQEIKELKARIQELENK